MLKPHVMPSQLVTHFARGQRAESAIGLHFFRRSPWVTACGAVSMLLFMASLTQDCFFIDRPENPRAWSNGLGLLLVGWLGILIGMYSWLANPALLIAWLTMWSPAHRRYAIGAACLALMLMLSFLQYDDLMSDEAGNRSKITAYGPGLWLWIGSACLALLGSCFQASKPRCEDDSKS